MSAIKQVRKWSRILHRDIGFFFVGASIIYGISGLALNHLKDWNPNYTVETIEIRTNDDFSKEGFKKEYLEKILTENGIESYKSYYYPGGGQTFKAFIGPNSYLIIDVDTGAGIIEYLKKRTLFYEVNYLHYNPNIWWTVFSDIFAGALILFAITSFFMVRGKKGVKGRGGIYIALGIIIPILMYFLT